MNHRCLTRGHNHLTSRMCTESCTYHHERRSNRTATPQARQVEVRTAIRRGFARHPPVTRTGSTHMPARIKYVDSETESATRMRTYSDFRRMSMSHVPRCPSHAPPPRRRAHRYGTSSPHLSPPLSPPPALRRRDLARVRAAWRATHSHTHTPAPAASRTHIYLRFRTVWSLSCVSWQWRCRPKCRPTHCFRSPQRWGCHFRSQRWVFHFRSPQRWVCHFRSPQRWVCSCSPPFSMLAKAS